MGRQEATLQAIFAEPTRANIAWREIESLLAHLGAEVSQGNGSRVRVSLNGIDATFHRPHPKPQAHKPMVRAVRRFLESAGVGPS